MQTFLPYADYYRSANVLDTQRLRKQIIEGIQIFHALALPGEYGWQHHPAVTMWRGAHYSLLNYISTCHYHYVVVRHHHSHFFDTNRLAALYDWVQVSYENGPENAEDAIPTWGVLNMLCRVSGYYDALVLSPEWLGNTDFHQSHRSNLIRKRPDYYRAIWPDVPDNLPYVWPPHGRKTPKRVTLFRKRGADNADNADNAE